MSNLLRFETQKIWRQRKTYLLIIGSVLLVFTCFLFNKYMETVENEMIDQDAGYSRPIVGRKVFDSELEEYLKSVNLMIEEQEESFITAAGKGESLEEVLTLPTYPFYRAALNNELIDRTLPVYSMRYGTQSSVFAAIAVTGLASILGIIYFLFLFGDGIAKEFEERTINLSLTQPISRVRLFLLKYAVAVSHAFLLSVVLVMIAAIIGFILTGVSSWQYPVIVFTEKSMMFISIFQYILCVFSVFFFVLLFCFAVHFLFSTLFRKTALSLVMTIFVLVEGHFLSVSSSNVLRKVAHLNPFVYLNVGKLFVGYDFRDYQVYRIENQEYYANWCLPRVLHNTQINATQGFFVLGLATLLVLSLGCYCFKKNSRLEV